MKIKKMAVAIGMRKGDFLLIVMMITAAAALLAGMTVFSHSGTRAVLITPEKEIVLDLHHDTVMTLQGKQDIQVTIEVKNGRVRFQQSSCPDQICVHSGWLSQSGQSAACLPAGIALRVMAESSDMDAIAG